MNIKTSLILFFLVVLVYNLSWLAVYVTGVNKTLIPSEDTLPAIYLPISLIKEKNFDLNEYYDFLVKKYPNQKNKAGTPFYVRVINGKYISAFPVMAPILAVPIYLIPVLFLKIPVDYFWPPILAKISASIMVSLSTVFIYLAVRELLDGRRAVFLSLIYAFGTCSYALSSQGLWQHAPSQMFLSLSSYFLLSALKRPGLVCLSGLALALATLSRPTSVIPALILTIYILHKHKKEIFKFFLLTTPVLFFMFWYNFAYIGSFFSSSYDKKQMFYNWQAPFPEGFLGIWLSPSKGLLTYSPIFIFSLIGIYLLFKREKRAPYFLLFRYSALVVLVFTLVVGKWYHWFGGWAFGYRMAVDITPFLILLLVPVLESKAFPKLKNLFYFFVFWSIFVQVMGIVFFDGEWHARFDRGFKESRWLWSIKDSEMVFYLKKILTKIGL